MRPVEDVIANTLKIDRAAVNDSLAFNAIPQWDSLGHVDLMVALEGVYGIAISEEQMVVLMDVPTIREFVHRAGM